MNDEKMRQIVELLNEIFAEIEAPEELDYALSIYLALPMNWAAKQIEHLPRKQRAISMQLWALKGVKRALASVTQNIESGAYDKGSAQ